MKPMKILIVEDDPLATAFLCQGLIESGHQVDQVNDGNVGLQQASDGDYDVLILDRMLPGREGTEIVETLRRAGDDVPVLMLTALGEVADRVDGLRAGADDYLPKPFSFAELLARIESITRRRQPDTSARILRVADLELDRVNRTAARAGKGIHLQPREFRLLEYLMRYAGRVLNRTELLEQVWGYRFDPETNIVDMHISRLRRKIDKDFEPPLLVTVRGAGYVLRDPR